MKFIRTYYPLVIAAACASALFYMLAMQMERTNGRHLPGEQVQQAQ
jgi:hypothetical protein